MDVGILHLAIFGPMRSHVRPDGDRVATVYGQVARQRPRARTRMSCGRTFETLYSEIFLSFLLHQDASRLFQRHLKFQGGYDDDGRLLGRVNARFGLKQ